MNADTNNNSSHPGNAKWSGPKVLPISTALSPGRKRWLLDHAAEFFRRRPCHTLVEPFAGSAIIGLSLLWAGIIQRLILVERDERMAWILMGQLADPYLAYRYAAFDCSLANVTRLCREETSPFRYLVETRCNYMSRLPNKLKAPNFRNPIDCKWNRKSVVPNLRRVFEMRDRISVVYGDGLSVMRDYANDRNVGCFADAPYTADQNSKGRTLYKHHKLNHPKLFSLLAQWRGPWLATEDNFVLVRRLALCYGMTSEGVWMRNFHHDFRKELVIYRKRRIY